MPRSGSRARALTLIESLERRVHLAGQGTAGISEPAPDLTLTTTTLPTAAVEPAATTVGGKVYVGGGATILHPLDTVEVYDPSTGQWSPAPPLPTAGRIVATTAGNFALFSGALYPHRANAVDYFDTATNTWSSRTFPTPLEIPFAVSTGQDAIFINENQNVTTAEIYDADANRWSVDRLPVGGQSSGGAAVGTSAYFDVGGALQRYDAAINQWSVIRTGVYSLPITGIGTTLINQNGEGLELYNTITGRFTTVPAPPDLDTTPGNFSIDYDRRTSLALGTKVLLFGVSPPAGANPSSHRLVVYDVASGTWSAEPFAAYRANTAKTTVGNQAIIAGGGDNETAGSNEVDILMDNSPASVLSGGVNGAARGRTNVVVQNTGDADYAGPYTMQIYAIPPRQYRGAVLLGSAAVNSPLAAGQSVRLSVPISLPTSAPPGTYHLVAMSKAADGTLTPFAGGTATFTVPAKPSASMAAANVPTAAFSVKAIQPQDEHRSWLEDR